MAPIFTIMQVNLHLTVVGTQIHILAFQFYPALRISLISRLINTGGELFGFMDCLNYFHVQVNGLPITIGVGSIVSEEGFSMLMSAEAAESVWNTLLAQGAIPMASDAWEKLRIYEGDGGHSCIEDLDRK